MGSIKGQTAERMSNRRDRPHSRIALDKSHTGRAKFIRVEELETFGDKLDGGVSELNAHIFIISVSFLLLKTSTLNRVVYHPFGYEGPFCSG
jgi:hypothetical protein